MKNVLQVVDFWHAEEGHPGQIDTCSHRLCREAARTDRKPGSAPDYWPGHRVRWGRPA